MGGGLRCAKNTMFRERGGSVLVEEWGELGWRNGVSWGGVGCSGGVVGCTGGGAGVSRKERGVTWRGVEVRQE